MHDSYKFHRPACEKVTQTVPAMGSTAAIIPPGHRRGIATRRNRIFVAALPQPSGILRGALVLAMLSLVAADLPRAAAASADARSHTNQVHWRSAARQPSATTAAEPARDARLKWKQSPAAPRRLEADEPAVPLPGPALTAAQVRHAVPSEAESDESGKVRLTSFGQREDDPALDPFQDEVVEDETNAPPEEEGEEPEAGDELTEDEPELIAEGDAFSPDEVAQRSGNRDAADLPDELRFDQRDEMPLPDLDAEYAQAGPGEPERCPSPRDLKPINQISHRIAAEPGLFPQECALSDYEFQPRNFKPITFTWKASALCHKPLYFQQPKLERYGHTFGILTPIISMGHFFVMVPCLPYNMGMELPWECVYPLGWYRPGDCAPYTIGPLPLSLRGAALQGVVTTGFWFLFQ